MLEFPAPKTALVTGATGYIAHWIVKRLLDEGFRVHATVRDPSRTDKLEHLDRLAEASPGTIHYFQADLLDDGSFRDAMADCTVVFHTASPFSTSITDPHTQLIEPALHGTRNVLRQVDQTPSVRRVVLTSSCAAIYGDNADLARTPSGAFTEADWNTSSTPTHQPYSYSKTVAERAAWELADAQDRWTLVAVNPSLVVGPAINPHTSCESIDLILQYLDGTLKFGAPNMGIGVVDIRDVAEAHLRAAFHPNAHGRYVTSAHDSSLLEIGRVLHAHYGKQFPLPTNALPKWLLWLVGPFVNASLTRKVVSRNVNLPWSGDHKKSQDELGLTYRPLQESLVDMVQQLIEAGRVTPRQV